MQSVFVTLPAVQALSFTNCLMNCAAFGNAAYSSMCKIAHVVEQIPPIAPDMLAGVFFANASAMRGKTAVITGTAAGLGLAFATRCAEDVNLFGMLHGLQV